MSPLMFSLGNCISSQMITKKREYVAVMFGFPGVVQRHITCPKFCSTLPEASHLTRLWPCIINRHLALLSQEFDSRPAAFSEVLTKWLFVVHWVEWCPSGDAMYSQPSSLPVFPVVSCFVTSFFFLSIRSTGILCRCCHSLVTRGQLLWRSTNVFCPVSICRKWHGRLDIRQS